MLALCGLNASLGTLRILAERGLLSPDEVEGVANGITAHLFLGDADESLDADALRAFETRKAAYIRLAATVEEQTGRQLAGILQTARENWTGD